MLKKEESEEVMIKSEDYNNDPTVQDPTKDFRNLSNDGLPEIPLPLRWKTPLEDLSNALSKGPSKSHSIEVEDPNDEFIPIPKQPTIRAKNGKGKGKRGRGGGK